MQDVVYLLWSSVDPAVLNQHEDHLLQFYMLELQTQLLNHGVHISNQMLGGDYRGQMDGDPISGLSGGQMLSEDVLRRQYEVCLLDYVRFLVGSMWGACTPESFVEKAGMLNQGMHKRDVGHHLRMIHNALAFLAAQKQNGLLQPQDN